MFKENGGLSGWVSGWVGGGDGRMQAAIVGGGPRGVYTGELMRGGGDH